MKRSLRKIARSGILAVFFGAAAAGPAQATDAPAAVITESVVYAGKQIDVSIPEAPVSYSHAEVRQKIMCAISAIDDNAGKIGAEDTAILQGINKIALSDSISRSYIDEDKGFLSLRIGEAMDSSCAYLADGIAHDSFHVAQFRKGGTDASRSTQAEIDAVDFQLKLAFALGVSPDEQQFLVDYKKDTKAIDQRRYKRP